MKLRTLLMFPAFALVMARSAAAEGQTGPAAGPTRYDWLLDVSAIPTSLLDGATASTLRRAALERSMTPSGLKAVAHDVLGAGYTVFSKSLFMALVGRGTRDWGESRPLTRTMQRAAGGDVREIGTYDVVVTPAADSSLSALVSISIAPGFADAGCPPMETVTTAFQLAADGGRTTFFLHPTGSPGVTYLVRVAIVPVQD